MVSLVRGYVKEIVRWDRRVNCFPTHSIHPTGTTVRDVSELAKNLGLLQTLLPAWITFRPNNEHFVPNNVQGGWDFWDETSAAMRCIAPQGVPRRWSVFHEPMEHTIRQKPRNSCGFCARVPPFQGLQTH